MSVVEVRAHAKLNLFLRVGERRPDGYHELETLLHSISLADRLAVRRTGRSGVEIEMQPGTPHIAPESNLAVRAGRAYLEALAREHGGRSTGLAIHLEKAIPMGSGMGGGSADAAAVLVAADLLHDGALGVARLLELGRGLGADVPFCVQGGVAAARGIGERLERHEPRHPLHVLVVKPSASVSTAGAYAALDAASPAPPAGSLEQVLQRLLAHGAPALAGLAANHFEAVVFPEHPGLASIRQELLDHGARWAMMTGSGSAIFGVFDSPRALERAATELGSRLPGHELHRCTGATRGVEVAA